MAIKVEDIRHSRSVEFFNRKTRQTLWLRFETTVSFTDSSEYPEATAKAVQVIQEAFDNNVTEDMLPVEDIMTPVVKTKPDSKIMKQFMKAIEDNDEATKTMLTNIYDIKTE